MDLHDKTWSILDVCLLEWMCVKSKTVAKFERKQVDQAGTI